MTSGANLRDRDRYRREVREPVARLTAWLPGPLVWTSVRVRAVLASIMEQYPTVGDIPFKPAPPTRTGLTRCYLRLTQDQRGVIDLMAITHGTPGEPLPVSETLRGILAAWMEATE